jgi:hypothetical protein
MEIAGCYRRIAPARLSSFTTRINLLADAPRKFGVDAFLSQGRQGPEHHALVEALDSIGLGSEDNGHQELSAEAIAKLSCAVGQAVAQCWSRLPQEIQHELFEAAVKSEGEIIRQQLVVYLHGP